MARRPGTASASRRATRTYHPATRSTRPVVGTKRPATGGALKTIRIPREHNDLNLEVEGRDIRLTNLGKVFWPDLGITKGDLLQYYADVAPMLLPHLRNRAMVMKRYPNGAYGDFFFMKRAPTPRPPWIETCAIEHASGNVINFPMIQDLPALLWVVNLGCIDLNQWYATCDDVDRPDALHFDLDPTEGATFAQIRNAALVVRETLRELGVPSHAKTTGSRGIHVYVPIRRGPTQREVWEVARRLSEAIVQQHAKLLTTVYAKAQRPRRRVLVDYNQNAWGRTLASVYSVRPRPHAPVSMPVTWEDVEQGFDLEDFRMENAAARIAALGDLWKPLLAQRGRVDLSPLVE